MSTRNHSFASTAAALLAALATGSAFAIAPSSNQSAGAQADTTNQAAYSSNPSDSDQGSSDRSGSPSALISSPGESSEQSMRTYDSSDNSDSSGASAPSDSDDAATAPDNASDENQPSDDQPSDSGDDMHRMGARTGSAPNEGFTHVNMNTSDSEPAHTAMGPAVESTDASTSNTTIVTPSSGTAAATAPSSESAQPLPPAEPPAVVSAPDEPRYTPETGDAEYGSKLDPERPMPAAAIEPPSRFNDATGQ